jgi:hypothetical protein
MFCDWTTSVCHTDVAASQRRQRRCLPSLSGSASRLEDRVMLSGASAAEVAKTAARVENSHAGKVVTTDFEAILGTAPTSAQLVSWVDKLHSGTSAKALTKDLKATAAAGALIAADPPVTAVVVSNNPSAAASSSVGAVTMGALAASASASAVPVSYSTTSPFVDTISTPVDLAEIGLDVAQAPFKLAPGEVPGKGTGGGGTLGVPTGKATTTTSRAATTTTTSSTTAGSTSTSSTTPLSYLLGTGSVPTPGTQITSTTTPGTISSLSPLTVTPVTVSTTTPTQLTVTSTTTTGTSASVAPTTGLTTAPTTGLTTAPTTGLTIAPTTGSTVAPSSSVIS